MRKWKQLLTLKKYYAWDNSIDNRPLKNNSRIDGIDNCYIERGIEHMLLTDFDIKEMWVTSVTHFWFGFSAVKLNAKTITFLS